MRLRQLFEEPRTAVIAFGRMNPPTIGHQKLVDKIKSIPGDPYVFLSQSQKPKTDPLAFEDKLRYAKFFFPAVSIGHPEVKTIIQALEKVYQLGYKNLIYVAGSDRVQAFEELINKYNNSPDKEGNIAYAFDSIKVVSAGERDPDADGAEGMSASKMRQAAADNDLESFKQGVPREEVADEMFAAVRQGMGIKDTVPAESVEEGWFSSDDPIEMPGWLNNANKALWQQLNPIDDGSIRAKRLITQLQSLNRFAQNGLTDTANSTLAIELQSYQQLESIQTDERKLSRDERRSREVNFRKLKKHRSDFEKRYGDDAESVMYAVATKRAKGESIEEEENSWISNAWNTLKHGFDDPMTTDYIPFILKNIRRYGDRRTEQMLMRQFPDIKPVDAKRAMRMALDALHKRG